ncbi:TetR family transcriptional regulator [Streptomyces sp. 2333.5]|uniref:TetR/AcrR family transcriptional regulator n=1 Tax=unclassified Streptomyces TaxID=2593676 RepID=UPI0008972263|nr:MULTISPECIES: TetR/AcrR family transcriptional regulator [unclassified Streptomyces]PJJ06330.1 TetR family transcriptional regulator [Streptomyces sp. 2333.5]SEE93889.1 transcriptional regulator, TetR family [Streptomyces sp. 2314.4]SEF08897.1 transcriptional regulator, TetR family [Streptomyces sp. 2112.2]
MPDRPTQILEAAARLIARRGVRGLRVEEVSAEAGVSTALIYYHFKGRAGLLRRTLEFINRRAVRYTDAALDASDAPLSQLTEMLLLEFQDVPQVRENSAAWGELRATAVFDPDLRELLADATREWTDDLADLIRRAQAAGTAAPGADPQAAAERLSALVEGLSERWLSGTTTLERAHELVRGAVEAELGPA